MTRSMVQVSWAMRLSYVVFSPEATREAATVVAVAVIDVWTGQSARCRAQGYRQVPWSAALMTQRASDVR
jgi:hypothetical protein